jgi:DNA-binding CsgD family transcriptional regulator
VGEVVATALRGLADEVITLRHRRDDVGADQLRVVADSWMARLRETEVNEAADPLQWDLPGWVAQAHAELERLGGRSSAATWEEVAVLWNALSHPWCAAYARWRQAEAVLTERTDRAAGAVRADAAPALRAAWTGARALGAKPLVADIEDLAARARIPLQEEPAAGPEPAPVADPFGLTGREREVLELVAAGHSNGRIGEQLFISTKTASVHVSNILRKMGAANRIEAAAKARSAGLVPG